MINTDLQNSSKIMIGSTEAEVMYVGSNLIWKKSRLPIGYTELSYISSTSTGGQYIDLGCHLLENTDNIQIDIKFNIKGTGKSASGNDPLLATLIASQPEISPWPGFILRRMNADGTTLHLQAKWKFTNSTKQPSTSKYQSKYLTHPKTDNNNTLVEANWQNIYEFTEILDNIPSSQVNNCTCTLFCALDGSNNPFRYCEADLYYLKFTKGNTVVRDLIPAKRNSDNEVGLYDLQNDVFYASQGTSSFVAGT